MTAAPTNKTPASATPLELRHVERTLDAFPPAIHGNPLNLLLMERATPIASADRYLRALDSPELCEERREYLATPTADWPFPSAALGERPDPVCLSDVLFERFGEAGQILHTQSDIGQILLQRVDQTSPDIVVLMVVDGLSYYDLPENEHMLPCLVSGVSTTAFGHRSVLGRPPICQRLFSRDYKRQLGFTYFDPDENELACELYSVFGGGKVHRITELDEALRLLRTKRMSKGFVQVTSSGLDQLCHQHHDRPPIQGYVDEIMTRFERLVSCLSTGRRKVLACMTSDHGILWRDHLQGKPQLCPGIAPEDVHHPRYVLGGISRDCTLPWRSEGTTYSLLRFPFLTRPLRHTEWGVHGGISAWESIVPLVIQET